MANAPVESTNLVVFDKTFYEDLANIATEYYREFGWSRMFPVNTTSIPNAKKYKKPIFGDTEGFTSNDEYDGFPDQARTSLNTRKYKLHSILTSVIYSLDDRSKLRQFLLQDKGEKMRAFARQIDLTFMKGHYSKGYDSTGLGVGTKMSDGILDQAGTVIDLDGTDSALGATGGVYAALKKMVESIPFRYRGGRECVLGMTSNFYAQANSSTFTNTAGQTEWEQFFDKLVTKGIKGWKVSPEIIISDEAFIGVGDAGGTTDDRLFIAIMDNNIVERVFSRGIAPFPVIQGRGDTTIQDWAARCAGCVHDDEAVLYSEKITWP